MSEILNRAEMIDLDFFRSFGRSAVILFLQFLKYILFRSKESEFCLISSLLLFQVIGFNIQANKNKSELNSKDIGGFRIWQTNS
jgi:hypothetical protein